MAGPSDTREAVSGPMLSLTTAREHFKQWVAQPQMAFQELPSFAGRKILSVQQVYVVLARKHAYGIVYVYYSNCYKILEI